MTSDKFIGYLVSVECKNVFYQGIVSNIDPIKSVIQLKDCYQNGINCGNKLVDLKTTEIENIQILADPNNALSILRPRKQESIAHQQQQQQQHTQSNSTTTTPTITNNILKKLMQPLPSSKPSEPSLSSAITNSTTGNEVTNHYQTKSTSQLSPLSTSSSSSSTAHHQELNNHRNNNNYNNNKQGYSKSVNRLIERSSENLEDEFDFEKNLALFDKNAFYEEVEGHPKSSMSSMVHESFSSNVDLNKSSTNLNGTLSARSTNTQLAQMSSSSIIANMNNANLSSNQSTNAISNNKNYRYDQMVLDTGEPMNFDQIKVPCKYITKRYVTDDGFFVPCIDYELRERLFEQSYKFGFKKERHIESLARSCTEMALQLVGGPIRFSPKNNHQKPSILLFANSSLIQGCYAVCTARMLSTRQVKTHLFVYDNPIKKNKEDSDLFQCELNLFNSGDSNYINLITNIEDLKKLKSVDLIINGLESAATLNNFTLANQAWFRELIRYVDGCKANVLTIDPCQEGSALQSKWSILPILPMAMSSNCGRVYLCDLGFTSSVFNSCNVKYQSPFGAKFLIPLHND